MEYQKITNLLDDSSSKTSKFRTKNWVEINMNQEENTMMKNKSDLKQQC